MVQAPVNCKCDCQGYFLPISSVSIKALGCMWQDLHCIDSSLRGSQSNPSPAFHLSTSWLLSVPMVVMFCVKLNRLDESYNLEIWICIHGVEKRPVSHWNGSSREQLRMPAYSGVHACLITPQTPAWGFYEVRRRNLLPCTLHSASLQNHHPDPGTPSYISTTNRVAQRLPLKYRFASFTLQMHNFL